MLQSQTVEQVEADLAALKATAERAGTTLACLFSCSDEFEAAVIKARRASGAFAPRRHPVRALALTLVLAAIFLML